MGETEKGEPAKARIKKVPKELNLRLSKSVFFDKLLRTASDMWNEANDPFQVFEVEHEACLDLKIVVQRGENITKGFYRDLIDIPDPYVILRVPGSSNSSKRTSHIDNSVTPEWNETFHFFLDPKKKHKLQVTLMDANHWQDEDLGCDELDISLVVPNCESEFTFEFEGGSKVYATVLLQKNLTPDLRFSLSLCEEEKAFLRARRQRILTLMPRILGPGKGPKNKEEVPIVAMLGSGGGFRAMICLSAATKVLHETNILDCCTYISGLSGSSWFISNLYAYENFPTTSLDGVCEDLKDSVTSNWKWNLMHCHRYILNMLEKKRRGQPVSFTDIFGHLLGDVLLKEKKHKKLSDQRKILRGSKVPLPLYTCLHAKASVSCRAFSEWIEFSPFEIGIAKYGTFMKSEYFGSKFLVGKMIKTYPEFPLFYLQGVWGSAFTILMKRLAFDGGSKQDIVQMMRDVNEERAINEKLEDENICYGEVERESESDDEADVEGADDRADLHLGQGRNPDEKASLTLEEEKERLREILGEEEEDTHPLFPVTPAPKTGGEVPKSTESPQGKRLPFQFSFDFATKQKTEVVQDPTLQVPTSKVRSGSMPNLFSFGGNGEVKANFARKGDRLQRKGAMKEGSCAQNTYWSSRRTRRMTQRAKKCSVFQNLMQRTGVLDSRAGRAGEILNPFRGLSLKNSFPLSPFSPEDDAALVDGSDNPVIGKSCRYEPLDNTAKRLFIVDSGLAFNSPYPLLLRPQRAVDMYLSFDFSQRSSDDSMPFKELLLAEKWANQNQVLFPPIEKLAEEFSKDKEVKELYIFKDPNNPFCPVILHFTIVNNKFRHYKSPGIRRTNVKERDFANFDLFDDPAQPYASTNFVYEPLQYERLFKLVEFNTLLNIDNIKREIEEMIAKKREMMAKQNERQVQKMVTLLKCKQKFQNLRKGSKNDLGLRLDEKQTKKLLQIGRSVSNSSKKEDDEFFDSYDNLSDYDFNDEAPFFDTTKDLITESEEEKEISEYDEEKDSEICSNITDEEVIVQDNSKPDGSDTSEDKEFFTTSSGEELRTPKANREVKMIQTFTAEI